MTLYNETTGEIICDSVTYADTFIAQARGRMFTRSISKDTALVFPNLTSNIFTGEVGIWMMFVPYDLGVLWISDGTVTESKVLSAWTGRHSSEGDMIIELHPESLSKVSIGDKIEVGKKL